MNIIAVIQNQVIYRIRQFGLMASSIQIVTAIFRPIVRLTREVILVIYDHKPETDKNSYPEIREMTIKFVVEANKNGVLTMKQAYKFKHFLEDGCRGFIAYVDNNFAGYIFIQIKGTYKFGSKGRFIIPDGMIVIKNLFVFPPFRGYSLSEEVNWCEHL
jgi:hypothetical protein